MRLIKVKRMEFSAKVSMTGDFGPYGEIKAVLDEGKWIFRGRREATLDLRKRVDKEMSAEWKALNRAIQYLPKCMICLETMQEEICLRCNDEDMFI